MSTFQKSSILAALALIAGVSGHGIVTGYVADGVYYQGYDPSFQYQQTPPVVAGWTAPLTQDRGFVADYSSPDIICHKSATPGGAYVKVTAGNTIELQWTQWPESHHGPVIDYLAHCANDDCTAVDKTSLLWNKIDEDGLINGSPQPGHWASDDLIANNNSWVATIPASIAPGKYVLRHEIIALHSANNAGGAQNYPQCLNLEITGSGSNSLSTGTEGTSLYTATDPGIFVNIYLGLASYIIPGPKLYSGAGSDPQPSVTASTTASASSAPAISTDSTTQFTSITATPSTGIAVPTVSATEIEESTPTPVAPTSSSEAPVTLPTIVPEPEPSSQPSSTSPVSFTSTFTGRIGKPTKFTCYAEE